MITLIEIGEVYYLDLEFPVKIIKAINRSNTIFSVEKENGAIETVELDRLSSKEPMSHSIPEIYNDSIDDNIEYK